MKKIVCALGAVILGLAAMPASAVADTFVFSSSLNGSFRAITGGYGLIGADINLGDPPTASQATLTAVAQTDEVITYYYTYVTEDCCGAAFDPAGYFIGNKSTVLSDDHDVLNGNPTGAFNRGIVTLDLKAGDEYGFYVQSGDSQEGPGEIFFSTVAMIDPSGSVMTPTPEPAAWVLMIGGFGAAGSALRRRKRQVRAGTEALA